MRDYLGNPVSSWPIYHSDNGVPIVGDVSSSNPNKKDIAFGSRNIFFWDTNANEVTSSKKIEFNFFTHAPLSFSEFGNTGKNMLVASSNGDTTSIGELKDRSSLYVWEFNDSNSSLNDWPMFQHDPQH